MYNMRELLDFSSTLKNRSKCPNEKDEKHSARSNVM